MPKIAVTFLVFVLSIPTWGTDNSDIFGELEFDPTAAETSLGTRFKKACTLEESWDFQGTAKATISPNLREEFKLFLMGVRQPFAAYSEVTARKEEFESPEAIAFFRYWAARVLFSAKLYAQASKAFEVVIEMAPNARILPFQKAAILCKDAIRERAPHISYSKRTLGSLVRLYNPMLITEADLKLLAKPTIHYVFHQIRTGNANTVNRALVLLEQSGEYEALARAFWGLRQRDMETAVHYLTQLLSTPKLPPGIEDRRDELRLLLATALYDQEDYLGAITQLESVSKKSNELVDAISRLASAHLMQGNLTHAIGTAVILNSGDFRRTFVPEIYMVMAMGLNELCQFPEAFNIVSDFKRQYLPSYQWLKAREENGGKVTGPLYPELLAFLKKKPTSIPERILTEWSRSPIFLKMQQGINTVFASQRDLPRLRYQVTLALQQAGEELNVQELLKKAVLEETNDPGGPRAKAAQKAVDLARARFNRLDKGRAGWDSLLVNFLRDSQAQKSAAVTEIDQHLSKLTRRMFRQLTRVVENNELVEAEILTGVSRDIILSNAKGPQKTGQVRKPAHSRYKWSTGGEALVGIEVWEDEVGTLEAAVANNCSGPRQGGN